MIFLNTPLSSISGIGNRFGSKLKKLGLETAKDLLWHFPYRYEDFSEIYQIAELIPRQEATICGIVDEINTRKSWKRKMLITEALISDESGSIRAIWFNQPYIKNILAVGTKANFSGKVSTLGGEIYLSNPTYEIIKDKQIYTKHTGRIVGIYPETKGLTSKGIRNMIDLILKNISLPKEFLPHWILKEENLMELKQALKEIHFPTQLENAISAKKRFVFEDLFLLQLYNLAQKVKLAQSKSINIPIALDNLKQNIAKLPFTLTPSQKKSLWEILKDTSKKIPMNRLLQGDVGSGKTIIAALAALNVAFSEKQVAFMAPTSILATQHFNTFIKFFSDFDGGVALLTSKECEVFYGNNLTSEIKKKELEEEVSKNKIKIVIGTHALLQKYINFPELALVIIDEQHRFGVKQRFSLLRQKTNFIPHFLSMSATPIPRTLSLTIFGDLDISLITELPENRKKVLVRAVSPEEKQSIYQFIRKEIQMGRQAFVICPRIEAPNLENSTGQKLSKIQLQNLELKSVKEEYEKLSKKIFPDLKVGMLYGKMKEEEKEKTMLAFIKKEIEILVATSVVEVGIDVPNATIMMVENAERFGLAQLYQFKGRVGRGEHQSYCFLFSDSNSKTVKARLNAILKAKNGFELAEEDLKLRGPGEFLGESQTGMPDLAMKAIQNPELVKKTRELALKLLKEDWTLKNYPELKEKLKTFEQEIHWE